MPRSSPLDRANGPGDLDWALPPVRSWFLETFGTPTPAQRGGWPSISAGKHTLISAPTGTGKTLAAFLACLDASWRVANPPGTQILYVSPLKALNRDIAANLKAPRAGIVETADRLGEPLRPLSVGVRTGDTTAAERRTQARRPPDVLITTPESLHLLLSSRAREALRSVSHVIVDEIHDLCSSKRGTSLALLLERLEQECPAGFVRIGLSATMTPLDDVARFLGGWRVVPARGGETRDEPRPVVIVDAGVSKRMEVRVAAAAPSSSGDSVPIGESLESQILGLVRGYRTTLIFANNRAEVERLTVRLNREAARGGHDPGPSDRETVRSHHGSLSLEQRRGTEEALKRGELAAVVATASLELGIDVGSVDLVAQVGSPGSVSRGLQRVGRAGHSAGMVSRACFFGRSEAELLELAALAGAMREGAVEPVRIPRNCLDVLAQQVVACVATGPRDAEDLLAMVRRSDPYRSLPTGHFEAVLAMLSGRSEFVDVRDLRPRIRWDTLANRLEPLPGTSRFALMGGGTIPDSGQVPVYLEGGPRLGEFDEEFVMERRVGDSVLLGTSAWMIRSIDSRRVVVSPASGQSAVLPFWRGEGLGRSTALGERVGALRRQIAERLGDSSLDDWLADQFSVDPAAGPAVIGHVEQQLREAGAVPDDRTVLVESFLDSAGVRNLAIMTPLGRRFHLGLSLVLRGVLRDHAGRPSASQHADDGVLLQFPGVDEPPADLLDRIAPDDCEAMLLAELRDSPLFALRFRQVAARALLSGRPEAGGRTPLWFQRVRADELLGTLGGASGHPLIVETVRECLDDDLDLPRLRSFFGAIRSGAMAVRFDPSAASPSPFAAALARTVTDRFAGRFEQRARRRGRSKAGDGPRDQKPGAERTGLESGLARIDPDAAHRVDSRLRGLDRPPRSVEELAERLRFCGDLMPEELSGPMAAQLDELAARGVATRIRLGGVDAPDRWILVESLPAFEAAFAIERGGDEQAGTPGSPSRSGRSMDPAESTRAVDRVVRDYLRSRALVGAEEIAARYGIGRARSRELLERLAAGGDVIRVTGAGADGPERWGDRRNVEEVRRLSIAMRRKEAVAVEPDVFSDFLVRHQHAHPDTRRNGREGLEESIGRLRGFAPLAPLWEAELLPSRVRDFVPVRLDELLRTGDWVWRRVETASETARVALVPRGFEGDWRAEAEGPPLSGDAEAVLEAIRAAGLAETEEIGSRVGLDARAIVSALTKLSGRGLIGGDHFDPIRRASIDLAARSAPVRSRRASGREGAARRRRGSGLWETSGVRWSAFRESGPGDDAEPGAVMAWALALLDRYGVLCRETAALDPWSPPWSVLRAALDAAELRGEVRRGYFVSGLSGVQFALDAFADGLARHRPGDGEPVVVRLSTLDPANLYGSGGPFELPDPGRGGGRLVRSTSNHVVLVRGRPVLVSEGFGRSLSTFPWAGEEAIAAAIATLPGLAGPGRRIVKVRVIDGRPALESLLAARLIEVGFVRDPPGLALYAGW